MCTYHVKALDQMQPIVIFTDKSSGISAESWLHETQGINWDNAHMWTKIIMSVMKCKYYTVVFVEKEPPSLSDPHN